MPKIAIVGPGAIGGTVAAWLAQRSDHSIIVCARTPFDQLKVETPQGVILARPKILYSPEQASVVDWVLIATKAYAVPETVSWLPRLIGSQTCIAVLQNGVEHVDRFAANVPNSILLPVVIDMPAERLEPGHIWQRRNGKLIVPANDSGWAFSQLFSTPCVTVVPVLDFQSQAWRKLAINCAGAVSALVLQPARIARRQPIAAIMRELVRECIDVGRAEGANLGDDLNEEIIESYKLGPPDAVNSMHADRIAGRPIEIDARNGAVVRFGIRHGIPTPMNQTFVSLLKVAVE